MPFAGLRGIWMLFLTCVPACVLGLLLHSQIKSLFTPSMVLIPFVIGALLMIFVERRQFHPRYETLDRSERKLREKLAQGGYPDCCVDAAIDYVKSFHYLDDYRFASTYVRYHQDSLSRRQLEQKLMTKGIGRDDINCAIDSEYTADEKKQRQALIAEINDKGYKQVMEEVAYTWFNRFSALRFMEVNVKAST